MKKYFNIKRGFYIIGLVVVCFVISLYIPQNPLMGIYARRDTSVYQYIAKMMWQGFLPYRDIFDHKGPVVYFWNMIGYGIHPMYGQWFLEFLLLIGSAWLAFIIGCKYLRPHLVFLLTGAVFLLIPWEDTVGNTECLSVFLYFVFLYCCVQYERYPRCSFVGMGAVLALQLFIKQTHMMMGIIFGIGLLLSLLRQKKYRLVQDFLFYATMGFGIIFVACFGWLQQNGILMDFYQEYVLFNFSYTDYWRHSYILKPVLYFFLQNEMIQILLGLMVVMLLSLLGADKKLRPMIALGILATLGVGLVIIMPHQPITHYIYMLYPLLWILLVLFCLRFKHYPRVVLVVIFVLFMYGVQLSYRYTKSALSLEVNDFQTETVAFLKENMQEQDDLVVLGFDMCRLYLMLDKPSATRYAMSSSVNLISPLKLFTDIQLHLPKYVVLMTGELQYYVGNFNSYWPLFGLQYQPVLKNDEYYVFKRLAL